MSIYNKPLTKEEIRWRNKLSASFKKEHKKHRTEAEEVMYKALKTYFKGISKVIEQKVMFTPQSFVMIDFFLNAFWVGVEVDGGYHNITKQQEKDKRRSDILSKRNRFGGVYGVPIIRVSNEDVLNDVESVIKRIYDFCIEVHNSRERKVHRKCPNNKLTLKKLSPHLRAKSTHLNR